MTTTEKKHLSDKSTQLALSIMDVFVQLKKRFEVELATLMLDLGGSVGVNIEAGLATGNRKEIGERFVFALAKTRETLFWLRLLESSAHYKMDVKQQIQLCEELILLLIKLLKPSRPISINNKEKIKDN